VTRGSFGAGGIGIKTRDQARQVFSFSATKTQNLSQLLNYQHESPLF
jgi:hypothetical protein